MLEQRLLYHLYNSAQVREFVVFFNRLAIDWIMPFLTEQLIQQPALVPAFVRAIDTAQ